MRPSDGVSKKMGLKRQILRMSFSFSLPIGIHLAWQLANRANLTIFLQGSPVGYPLYKKHGFEIVNHLDVDLREWAPGAKRNDKGYGNHRFRYMLRLPRAL